MDRDTGRPAHAAGGRAAGQRTHADTIVVRARAADGAPRLCVGGTTTSCQRLAVAPAHQPRRRHGAAGSAAGARTARGGVGWVDWPLAGNVRLALSSVLVRCQRRPAMLTKRSWRRRRAKRRRSTRAAEEDRSSNTEAGGCAQRCGIGRVVSCLLRVKTTSRSEARTQPTCARLARVVSVWVCREQSMQAFASQSGVDFVHGHPSSSIGPSSAAHASTRHACIAA
jgi:hypothetical protein